MRDWWNESRGGRPGRDDQPRGYPSDPGPDRGYDRRQNDDDARWRRRVDAYFDDRGDNPRYRDGPYASDARGSASPGYRRSRWDDDYDRGIGWAGGSYGFDDPGYEIGYAGGAWSGRGEDRRAWRDRDAQTADYRDDRQRGWIDRAGDELRSWFGADETGAGHRGRGPKGYHRSDDRIRDDICDRLTEDIRLDASDIEVAVTQGEVTLNGTVADRQAKRRAEDCAEAVSGVANVQNNLRVATLGTASG